MKMSWVAFILVGIHFISSCGFLIPASSKSYSSIELTDESQVRLNIESFPAGAEYKIGSKTGVTNDQMDLILHFRKEYRYSNMYYWLMGSLIDSALVTGMYFWASESGNPWVGFGTILVGVTTLPVDIGYLIYGLLTPEKIVLDQTAKVKLEINKDGYQPYTDLATVLRDQHSQHVFARLEPVDSKRRELEQEFQAALKKSVASCQAILKKYPYGFMAEKAQICILELGYQHAQEVNNLQAYERFIDMAGSFICAQPGQTCLSNRDRLLGQASDQIMQIHYKRATKKGTVDSLQSFLKLEPPVPMAKEVCEELSRMRYQQEETENIRDDWQTFLTFCAQGDLAEKATHEAQTRETSLPSSKEKMAIPIGHDELRALTVKQAFHKVGKKKKQAIRRHSCKESKDEKNVVATVVVTKDDGLFVIPGKDFPTLTYHMSITGSGKMGLNVAEDLIEHVWTHDSSIVFGEGAIRRLYGPYKKKFLGTEVFEFAQGAKIFRSKTKDSLCLHGIDYKLISKGLVKSHIFVDQKTSGAYNNQTGKNRDAVLLRLDDINFLNACRFGDLRWAQELARKIDDINVYDAYGMTGLMFAAGAG